MWDPEYSAAALPSRLRAAPEKNATLSMVPGTSNSVVSVMDLPASADSTSASPLARSSRMTASLASAAERSRGVAVDHSPKARRAALTARSTSSAEACHACLLYTSRCV